MSSESGRSFNGILFDQLARWKTGSGIRRVKQVGDHVWLVTFMHYDFGYFDDETCRLESIG